MGTNPSWEKRAAERREKRRGKERTSASGFTLDTFGRMSKAAEGAEAFIEEAKRWKSIEEVEKNRHLPIDGTKGTETRAQREEWSRSILDACED